MDGTTDSTGGTTIGVDGVGKGATAGGVGEGITPDGSGGWNREVKRGGVGPRGEVETTASVVGRE